MTSLTSCSHSDDVSQYSVHAVISVLSIKIIYWDSVFVFNINKMPWDRVEKKNSLLVTLTSFSTLADLVAYPHCAGKIQCIKFGTEGTILFIWHRTFQPHQEKKLFI